MNVFKGIGICLALTNLITREFSAGILVRIGF